VPTAVNFSEDLVTKNLAGPSFEEVARTICGDAEDHSVEDMLPLVKLSHGKSVGE
jgi:hypothetical protein